MPFCPENKDLLYDIMCTFFTVIIKIKPRKLFLQVVIVIEIII